MPGKPAARVGDMTAHGGTITGPGVPTVLIGKMPAATMGDMHVCPMMTPGTPPIPHVGGPITLGSTGVFIGKKPAARMGDMAFCVGPPSSIILGCMTVLIGEAGSGSQAGSAASAGAAKAQGISAPGALKAMEVPEPVESKVESHTVEIEFKDSAGKLLKGRIFELTDPNGQKVHASSDAAGRYFREGYPKSGNYSAKILEVIDATCDKSKMKGGDSCTIKAKATGYADNTPASVYVSLIDAEGNAEGLKPLTGVVQGETVDFSWSLDSQELRDCARVRARTQQSPLTSVVFQVVVGFQCATTKLVTIEDDAVQGKILLDFVEVPDVLFNHDSAIPSLDAKDYLVGAISTAIFHAKSHAEQELIVFGHADTTGKVRYNYTISECRAKMVKSLLTQDSEDWVEIARKKGKVEDYQSILKVLTERHGWVCDPGKIDGEYGPKTKNAVKAFQHQTNARYQIGLAEDGVVGAKTWRAIHRVLCGLVAKSLGIADPAVSSYPQWTIPKFGCVSNDGCFACGESFPIEEAEKDNYKSEKNRRVELVFLPQGLFHQEPPANLDKKIDKKSWPLTENTGIERSAVASTPLPWDNITVGPMFWDFIQSNMPHLDDVDKFHEMLQLIYEDIPATVSSSLYSDLREKKVSEPQYQIINSLNVQQLGAYRENVIYLNRQLVVDANAHPNSRWLLLMAMVHEAGHYLDDLIRNKYSTLQGDTCGEEGAAFARCFMTQDNLRLFDIDFSYANIECKSNAENGYSTELVLGISGLGGEARARLFWQYSQATGSESGTITDASGASVDVEFWSITGKGGVHEEITKKAAIAAAYKVPDPIMDGDVVLSAEFQFHKDEYCWDAHLYQGCAWPDVPYESDQNAATTNYKNMLAMAAAHSLLGWHWHGNLAYKSHYGEYQHWHSMCPSSGETPKTNKDVKSEIITTFKNWYALAIESRDQGLPGNGLVNIGKILHTVQDSYCHSHCWRRYVGDDNIDEFWSNFHKKIDDNGVAGMPIESAHHGTIWLFQGYTNQQASLLDDLHKLADQSYSLGYDRALQASTHILSLYKNGSTWEQVLEYLENVVYQIHPSRVNSFAGESHPWFKKRLTEEQEPNETIREKSEENRSKQATIDRLVKLRKRIEEHDAGGLGKSASKDIFCDPYGDHVCLA